MPDDFYSLQDQLLVSVRVRVKNGELTERGLARKIGISQPHMHHILSGARTLSIENADRILKNLGLTVSDLLASLDPPRIPPEFSDVQFGSGEMQTGRILRRSGGVPPAFHHFAVDFQHLAGRR